MNTLELANALELSDKHPNLINVNNRSAAELRRLHSVNADLLEALVELSRNFTGNYFDDPRSDNEIDAHQEFWENKARAAIAKATGGAA